MILQKGTAAMDAVVDDALQVMHALPGRLRVRLPVGDSVRGLAIEAGLRRASGVRDAHANPLTGTVLVRFDPSATNTRTILTRLRTLTEDYGPRPCVDGALPTVLPDPRQDAPHTPVRWRGDIGPHKARSACRPRQTPALWTLSSSLRAALDPILDLILARGPLGPFVDGLEILLLIAALARRGPQRARSRRFGPGHADAARLLWKAGRLVLDLALADSPLVVLIAGLEALGLIASTARRGRGRGAALPAGSPRRAACAA